MCTYQRLYHWNRGLGEFGVFWVLGVWREVPNNTQHFVQHIQKVKLEPGEVITSYDIKATFSSVPVDPSIGIVKLELLQDPTLPQRTNMSMHQIVTLLEFCHKNTFFSSKVSIMNRSMVLPWVVPSAPSVPTCLWKSLKSRPLVPPHTPLLMAKVHR